MKNFVNSKRPLSQGNLFLSKIEEYIPANSIIFGIQAFLESYSWDSWLREYEAGKIGRSIIHPKYLVGSLLFGLIVNIRSTRKLEEAANTRVELIYFLDGRTFDHTTVAKFRLRFKDALEDLNREIIDSILCKDADALHTLVCDGTRIRANNSLFNTRKGATIERMRADILAELSKRQRELDVIFEQEQEIERVRMEYEALLQEQQEVSVQELQAANAEAMRVLKQKEQELEQNRVKSEYEKKKMMRRISALEKRSKNLEKSLHKAQENDKRRKAKLGKNAMPSRVPIADPDANVLLSKEGYMAPNYTPVVTVDGATGAIIHQEVAANSEEAFIVKESVELAKELGGEPKEFLADTAFATGENLEFLEKEEIQAIMPSITNFAASNPANREDPSQPVNQELWKELPKKGSQLSKTAFIYDDALDAYHCPMGRLLTFAYIDNRKTQVRRYVSKDCSNCLLSSQCLKNKTTKRSIKRDPYDDVRERHGRLMLKEESIEKYKERSPKVETVFARIKGLQKIRNFLTRGHERVKLEWLWICTSYNLKLLLLSQ